MAGDIKIDLEENSKYRVAWDLALRIAQNEGKVSDGDRKYWLELYESCREVVAEGRDAATALKK